MAPFMLAKILFLIEISPTLWTFKRTYSNQFVNLVNTGYMLFNWCCTRKNTNYKDFFSLCILWCKLSSFGVKKVLSHNLHLWFFVPVWILMCFNKSALSMRDFLQWTQGYDFTPRWTLMWRFNEVLLDICLLHWKHLYDPRFTSVCVFLILRVFCFRPTD